MAPGRVVSSTVKPVKVMADYGLGETVYQKSCADDDGECEPAPPELVLQRNYEYAEAASCACGDQGQEHRGKYYVPAVVDSGFPVDGSIHIRLIHRLFDELGKNIRAKNVQLFHGFFRLAQGAHHELGGASVHISLNGLAYCF